MNTPIRRASVPGRQVTRHRVAESRILRLMSVGRGRSQLRGAGQLRGKDGGVIGNMRGDGRDEQAGLLEAGGGGNSKYENGQRRDRGMHHCEDAGAS